MIYLDHNATAPMLPEVAEAMAECLRAGHANPASAHAAGRRARRVLEEARESIGRLLGARLDTHHADQLIFTSGGTEANNLAVAGLARRAAAVGPTPRRRVILSAIEHPSVEAPAERLAREGFELVRLPVSPHGVVLLDRLPELLDGAALVSIMLGNNETGVLEPVADAARLCRAAGVLIHCDAVQAVGKIPVDFRALDVDALTVSAHKLHGPVGIGVLLCRHGVEPLPLLTGGVQQQGLRPGTEAVALAVGMRAALTLWEAEGPRRTRRLAELRDSFEARLRDGWPDLVVNGASAPRLPHVSNVAFCGLDRQALVMALDLAGVACSTGSACASGSSQPSPVLSAMGCPEAVIRGALRFSLGATTTRAEVLSAADRILKVCNELRLRNSSAIPPGGTRISSSAPV